MLALLLGTLTKFIFLFLATTNYKITYLKPKSCCFGISRTKVDTSTKTKIRDD